MPKFFVVGQIRTDHTFNVEVDAKDFDEAETIAIARAKGLSDGLVTIHRDSGDIIIDNISITETKQCKRKRPSKNSG